MFMPPTQLLAGAKIRLTSCTAADLAVIARWQQDAAFLRLYDARPAYPRSEAALNDWLTQANRATDAFVFGIRLIERVDPADSGLPPATDALIGLLELDGILWTHQVGGLSIGIGEPAYRGRGYGAEAMQLALAFAFHELNLHRVQLTVFAYNQPAIALYEKLGFQREGVYRQFLRRDGQRHDMYLYGLLAHEWAARRSQPG
jgi:RimJ/RimL family protein N-acetyltransferase